MKLYVYIYIYIQSVSVTEELMTGHSKVPIPGGFGACAGPNDGWHQVMHTITKSYLRLAVGWGSAPQLRKRLDELQMGVQAQPSTKLRICNLLCFEIGRRILMNFVELKWNHHMVACGCMYFWKASTCLLFLVVQRIPLQIRLRCGIETSLRADAFAIQQLGTTLRECMWNGGSKYGISQGNGGIWKMRRFIFRCTIRIPYNIYIYIFIEIQWRHQKTSLLVLFVFCLRCLPPSIYYQISSHPNVTWKRRF